MVCAMLIRNCFNPSKHFISFWSLVNLLFSPEKLLRLRIYCKNFFAHDSYKLGVVVASTTRVGDMPIVFIFQKYAKSQIFMKINKCTNLWRPFKKCQNLILKIEFSSLQGPEIHPNLVSLTFFVRESFSVSGPSF